MENKNITEAAKASLKRYFKDSQDIQHNDQGKVEMTQDEIKAMIHNDIEREELRLHELKVMQHCLQQDAKNVLEFIFGKAEESQPVHHNTIDEEERDLYFNTRNQLGQMNARKLAYMNK